MTGRKDVNGSISSTTTSLAQYFDGNFNVSLRGTAGSFVGTVVLQKSKDGGTTWETATLPDGITAASWAMSSNDVNIIVFEPSRDVQYRLNVTRTSGTLAYALYQ